MMNKDPHEDLEKFLYTKSKDWYYEDEYRFGLYNNSNVALQFGAEVISEIILGCKISSEHKKKVLSIYDKYKHNPKLYQAKRSDEEFKLVFEEIS
ncbi:MAG: hypothetical protein K9K76_10170 [Halanaerobiales bacterium]|nr:hypothetical protein [Halanaerobiales bacterium]